MRLKDLFSQEKPRSIIIGYNFPFLLWTAWAVINALFPLEVPFITCPILFFFSFCPACGLTDAYVQLLQGRGITDKWFGFILLLFIINMIRSFLKAARYVSGTLAKTKP